MYGAIVATVVILYIIYKVIGGKAEIQHGNLKKPPCLPVLPIVGSLPFIFTRRPIYLLLTEKTKRYGNVFAFYAGSQYTVVLNENEALREAFVKRAVDFADRHVFYSERTVVNTECRGIICKTWGNSFKRNHSTTMAILKQFGYGSKTSIEPQILEEVSIMIKTLQQFEGKPIFVGEYTELAAFNIIYNMMFGERFNHGDAVYGDITKALQMTIEALNQMFDIFPIIRYLPSSKKYFAELAEHYTKLRGILLQKIRESDHKTDPNFVTEYKSRLGSDYEEEELVYVIRDMLLGGAETVNATLRWSIVLIGNNPKIQDRLQKEIDSIVARDRLPSLDDRLKLPYTEAVMLEILRFRIVAPLGAPHVTTCDTEVAGFFVPAKTMIIPNLYKTSMDPNLWDEPEVFNPDRFLDEAGVTNREFVYPFSLGKRACIGEVLARQELFLFISGLFQNFNVLPPEGETSIRSEAIFHQANKPQPFKVRLVPRK